MHRNEIKWRFPRDKFQSVIPRHARSGWQVRLGHAGVINIECTWPAWLRRGSIMATRCAEYDLTWWRHDTRTRHGQVWSRTWKNLHRVSCELGRLCLCLASIFLSGFSEIQSLSFERSFTSPGKVKSWTALSIVNVRIRALIIFSWQNIVARVTSKSSKLVGIVGHAKIRKSVFAN